MQILYPSSDVSSAGWTANSSNSTFYQALSATSSGFATTNVDNSSLIVGFPYSFRLDASNQTAVINVQTLMGGPTATVNMSLTKDFNTFSHTAFGVTNSNNNYFINFTADPAWEDFANVHAHFAYSDVQSNATTGVVSVLQLHTNTLPPVPKFSTEDAVREKYQGDNLSSPTDIIANYLKLENWFSGKRSLEELYNELHFNEIDLNKEQWDPIAYHANKTKFINITNFEAADGKFYTRDEIMSKQILWERQIADGDFNFDSVIYALPNVDRYSFQESYNGLTGSVGNVLYTNGTLSSMYQDNGTELHVGYSASTFATGAVADFLPSLIGGTLPQLIINPYLASTDFTGQNTILEFPSFLRIDFSGSGYDRFVAHLHDGSSYISAVPSDTVTFAKNELVRLEFVYLIPELEGKFIINGVHNESVSDGDFEGTDISTNFYLGTDASSANAFSGGIKEVRFSDDLKLYP